MDRDDFRTKRRHIPIAREGIPYIVMAMFVTLVFAILGQTLITLLLLAVTLLIGHFFRDPERNTVTDELDVVSPADGNVISVKQGIVTPFFKTPCTKISIFMSIFDVHVNRVPVTGTVQGIEYRKGSFLAAHLDKAGERNEQNWVWIRSDAGVDVVLTQVAGLIARRIVCWPAVGNHVLQGERFGMIRFGSRLDVYVPEDAQIMVSKGKHVYSGETVLCKTR